MWMANYGGQLWMANYGGLKCGWQIMEAYNVDVKLWRPKMQMEDYGGLKCRCQIMEA